MGHDTYSNFKILVADRSEDYIKYIKRQCFEDISFYETSSMDEVLRILLLQKNINIIVMDTYLYKNTYKDFVGQGGLEIYPEIRKTNPSIPIIFFTTDEEHILDGIVDGSLFYVGKYKSHRNLQDVIADILSK